MKRQAAGIIGMLGLVTLAWGQDFAELRQTAAIDGQVICRIRAFVNGEPIFDDEVRDLVIRDIMKTASLPEAEQNKARIEIWRQGLDQLIEREVIFTEARSKLAGRPQIWSKLQEAADKEFDRRLRFRRDAAGVANDDEFKAMMETQGMSLDKLRRAEERQFIANEFIRSMIYPEIQKIGHGDLWQYYEEHPADFMAEDAVRWQDIFIDAAKHPSRQEAKLFAEQIAQRAKNGEDFALLVKQFDNGDSSFRNGEGLGQRRGEIQPPACEELLFQMKNGEIGLVEMATGYHVIRLVERTHAGKVPFDAKTQAEIRRKLQNLIADREYKRAVQDLKRKATIQVVDSSER